MVGTDGKHKRARGRILVAPIEHGSPAAAPRWVRRDPYPGGPS